MECVTWYPTQNRVILHRPKSYFCKHKQGQANDYWEDEAKDDHDHKVEGNDSSSESNCLSSDSTRTKTLSLSSSSNRFLEHEYRCRLSESMQSHVRAERSNKGCVQTGSNLLLKESGTHADEDRGEQGHDSSAESS